MSWLFVLRDLNWCTQISQFGYARLVASNFGEKLKSSHNDVIRSARDFDLTGQLFLVPIGDDDDPVFVNGERRRHRSTLGDGS